MKLWARIAIGGAAIAVVVLGPTSPPTYAAAPVHAPAAVVHVVQHTSVTPAATCGLAVPSMPVKAHAVVHPDGYVWYTYGYYCSLSECEKTGDTVGALPIVKSWHCEYHTDKHLYALRLYADATV